MRDFPLEQSRDDTQLSAFDQVIEIDGRTYVHIVLLNDPNRKKYKKKKKRKPVTNAFIKKTVIFYFTFDSNTLCYWLIVWYNKKV